MSQSGIAVRYTTLKLAVALSLCVPWIASCGSPDTQTLVSKAETYIGKHEYKAAVIELKNVLVTDRDNGRARYLLGVIYSDMEDYDLAETELRRALELNYDRANTTVALGKALFAAGNFAKVLEEVRAEGDVEKPLQAQMFALRARALIGLGRIQEARHSMQQAVDADAQVPEVLLVQATFAASEDHREQAAELVARAIERDPVNVTAWMMKGDLSRVGNDTEGAKASYRKVIEINPMNVPARLNIALLESAARNFEEARKQVEQARKVAPRNPMAIYMQGLVAFQERKYPAARDSVLQLLKGAPDNLPTLLLAGAVEYALGGYAQAEAYLERVVQRAPQNLYARVLLAQSAGKAGQVDHAIQVLEPGLKQAPRDSKVLALAGDLYMARNDFKTAAQYFAAATKNEPQSAILRTRLGQSRLALGETDRALADLESAAQLDADDYRADVALVISHVNRQQYAEAMKAIQSLEQKQPENPLTYNLKGTVYAGSNDIPEARKQFEHALKLNPTYVPAATNLALLDIRDKNPRAARGRLEAILQKDNGNVQALLSLAQLGPRIGATEKEQVDWLQRAAKANPGLVQPRILLAAYYMRVGNSKNAVEAAEQAQALKPDDASVLDTLGYAQLAAGQKERALATYSKLAALQPDSPFALNRLAMAQAGNADASAAAVTLKKALAIDRGYIPALISLANLHMQAGRHAEALKVAQQAQKEKPSSGAGYMLEGDVLMAEKNFVQAAKSYETALSKDRNAIIAMKLYGAHIGAGNSAEAQARFAQWLKDSPDDVVVRTYVAERSMQSGDWQRAIGLYEWLQQKNPDNVAVLNNLAWAYQEVGDERALAMAERAYTLHSENAAAADTLGWILLQRGDSARAFKILEKASAAAPKVDGIRLHLAQAAFKSGDKARARQELERLTASGSNIVQQPDARDLLKQLDR